MRTFKNKELCKDTLQRLSDGCLFDAEWQCVYNDVVNYNMDLDISIKSVFMNPRGIGNEVDWAYYEFSKIYHKFITNYNFKKKIIRMAYRI